MTAADIDSLDIAVAHKDYDVRGGGERLAEDLARTFDAPMYVGRRDEANVPEAEDIDIREIPLTRWQRWCIDRGGAPRSAAYMTAWQQVPALTEYDAIITSGNEPLWYVPEDDQVVVAYTHSTPRFHYDLFQSRSHGLIGTAYATAVRTLYQHNVTRPDLYVANSDVVARRVNQYWNIPEEQIRVVYPPVETESFDADAAPTRDDRYLYLGRLAGHKRVSDAVHAFSMYMTDKELVVAGTGPQEDELRDIAGENVEIRGYVSEEEKRELYASAEALIYPCENEDFGMVPVEAMASGTPVIGVEEGFTRFQIQPGRNGVTYDSGVPGVYRAVDEFEREGVEWSSEQIAEFAAANFGVEQFEDSMRSAVRDAVEASRVDPDFEIPDSGPVAELPAGGGEQRAVADGGGGRDAR